MVSGKRRRALIAAVTVGPLATYEDLLRTELVRVGYAPFTVNETVLAMARLSTWMQQGNVPATGLTPNLVEQFLAARRERCRAEPAACRGVRTVLRVLRGADVVPRAGVVDESPVASILADFRGYLVGERGLAVTTVRSYCLQAEKFLRYLSEPLGDALARLDAATVTTFVIRATTAARSVESTKALVTALRALLRYLHVEGLVPAGTGKRPLSPFQPVVMDHEPGV